MTRDLGLALGGLGGYNMHGAGILEALDERGVKPSLVSATSGQILVVAAWLEGENPSETLERETGNGVSPLSMAIGGRPGTFRPATMENAGEILAAALLFPLDPGDGSLIDKMPARRLIPTRSRETFEKISDILNDSDTGVLINVLDVASGREIVHGNPAARKLVPKADRIEPIDADTISSALWLSLYGLDGAPNGKIDGAYARSVIVRELRGRELILVAPPLPIGWNAPIPTSISETENWSVARPFANSCRMEIENVERLIAMDKLGILSDPEQRTRKLSVVERGRHYGHLEWFVEKRQVRDDAFEAGLQAIDDLTCSSRNDQSD
jgi:hypothetical protein